MDEDLPSRNATDEASKSHEAESYARTYRFALSLCGKREMAEDLTQEAWLRLLQANGESTRFQEPQAWLFRVVRNCWIDLCRRESIRPKAGEADIQEMSGWEQSPEEVSGNREELERSLKAMMSLPDRQREVLYLRAVEQMSIDEIVETLQINRSNVKATLSLARKKMRELIQYAEIQRAES